VPVTGSSSFHGTAPAAPHTCRVIEWGRGSATCILYRPIQVSGVTQLSGHVPRGGADGAPPRPPRCATRDATAAGMGPRTRVRARTSAHVCERGTSGPPAPGIRRGMVRVRPCACVRGHVPGMGPTLPPVRAPRCEREGCGGRRGRACERRVCACERDESAARPRERAERLGRDGFALQARV
jgi:hypothetical protein